MRGPRKNHARRLERIEDALPPIFVEIEALRILIQLLIDIDFHRHAETEIEPFLFDMQDRLEDMLDELATDSDDVAEQIRIAAICSAMVIADRGETVDIEVDDGEEPANDD